jgi:hypothetical protein
MKATKIANKNKSSLNKGSKNPVNKNDTETNNLVLSKQNLRSLIDNITVANPLKNLMIASDTNLVITIGPNSFSAIFHRSTDNKNIQLDEVLNIDGFLRDFAEDKKAQDASSLAKPALTTIINARYLLEEDSVSREVSPSHFVIAKEIDKKSTILNKNEIGFQKDVTKDYKTGVQAYVLHMCTLARDVLSLTLETSAQGNYSKTTYKEKCWDLMLPEWLFRKLTSEEHHQSGSLNFLFNPDGKKSISLTLRECTRFEEPAFAELHRFILSGSSVKMNLVNSVSFLQTFLPSFEWNSKNIEVEKLTETEIKLDRPWVDLEFYLKQKAKGNFSTSTVFRAVTPSERLYQTAYVMYCIKEFQASIVRLEEFWNKLFPNCMDPNGPLMSRGNTELWQAVHDNLLNAGDVFKSYVNLESKEHKEIFWKLSSHEASNPFLGNHIREAIKLFETKAAAKALVSTPPSVAVPTFTKSKLHDLIKSGIEFVLPSTADNESVRFIVKKMLNDKIKTTSNVRVSNLNNILPSHMEAEIPKRIKDEIWVESVSNFLRSFGDDALQALAFKRIMSKVQSD